MSHFLLQLESPITDVNRPDLISLARFAGVEPTGDEFVVFCKFALAYITALNLNFETLWSNQSHIIKIISFYKTGMDLIPTVDNVINDLIEFINKGPDYRSPDAVLSTVSVDFAYPCPVNPIVVTTAEISHQKGKNKGQPKQFKPKKQPKSFSESSEHKQFKPTKQQKPHSESSEPKQFKTKNFKRPANPESSECPSQTNTVEPNANYKYRNPAQPKFKKPLQNKSSETSDNCYYGSKCNKRPNCPRSHPDSKAEKPDNCHYGSKCNKRPNCPYQHPESKAETSTTSTHTSTSTASRYVPPSLRTRQ
jgi:hypothetical protein